VEVERNSRVEKRHNLFNIMMMCDGGYDRISACILI
jgi:hypothetical protein